MIILPNRYDQATALTFQNLGRFDANESVFLARQLEFVKSEIYQTLYRPLNAMQRIPVSTDIPAGAESFVWREIDYVGKAKIVANLGTDVPLADVVMKENTGILRNVNIGFKYDMQEVKAAAFAGVALQASKAQAAVTAHSQIINEVAWFGDTQYNLPGFVSSTSVPEVTLLADGTGSSKTFASKSADKIVRDINSLINKIVVQSKGNMRATEVWMPIAEYALIASTQNSTASDTTILEFLRRVNPGVEFYAVDELAGAGAGGTDRMYALENNSINFSLEVPQMLQTLQPQLQGYVWIVPMLSRFGGCVIKRPLAFSFADGI